MLAESFRSNDSSGPPSPNQWGLSVYHPSVSGTVTINMITFYAICATVSR
jgi:hypothetical protein